MECRQDEDKTDAPRLLDLKFHSAQGRGKNVKKAAHNNPVDITPESLYSLVMNGFSSDVAASI